MDDSETGPGAHHPEQDEAPTGSGRQETVGHAKTLENKLRHRIEKWAGDVGYWGQAANIVVGESSPTDYSTPLTAATFQLGSLSFHFDCVQDEDSGLFQVRMRGSTIPHISDRETLDRAMQESAQHGR